MKKFTPNIRLIAANTGWLFADKLIRMGVGVIVWVWVARYLGPEDFGLFNYALAFVTLLSPLATLGLDNLIVKDVVEKKENKDLAIGTAFGMRVTGGILAFFIALIVIFFLRPGEGVMHWMVGIIAFASAVQSFDVIDFWFQSLVRSKYTVIAKNAAFLIASGIRIYLIAVEAPVIAFAWVHLIEVLLGAAGMIFFYQYKKNNILKWRITFSKVRELFKDALLITLANSAVIIYMKIDIVLLGQMSTEASVGIYSAAAKISEIFYFFATVTASSVFPILLNEAELYNERLKKLFDLMVVIAYSIMLPVAFLAPYIIGVFGAKYGAASPVLSVHIWATVFVFLSVAQTSWYIRQGTRGLVIQFRRTLIGAVINIVLNIILIPIYDAYGAAIATIISYSYVGYFSNLFSRSSWDVFRLQTRSLLLINLFRRVQSV